MSLWTRLVRTAAPAAEALTVDDLKDFLDIKVDDDDTKLARIVADVVTVDGPRGLGIALVNQSWRLSLDGWPCVRGATRILFPLGPVSAITSITYVDPDGVTQTLAADQYVVDLDRQPCLIFPAEGVSWPSLKAMPGSVKVVCVVGFGATAASVPGDIIGALLIRAGHRFRHRGDGDTAAPAEPELVENVLGRYRRGRVA